jgi:hypothetical protein
MSMADMKPKVEFEPLETKCGTGWFVRIKLPLEARVYVDGFPTRQGADERIRVRSGEWLRELEGGKYA